MYVHFPVIPCTYLLSAVGLLIDLYRTACAIVLVLPVPCDVLTVLKFVYFITYRAGFAVIGVMVNSHSDIVKSLTSSLANPYSILTPHYPTQNQHVNAQGYAYSSTYNPLAVPSTSFNYVSSNTSNSRPSRAAPVMHWCTPGKSKCTYYGCTFTGSANSVEIHMMDRHLIYPPGWQTRKHQPDWDTDPSLKGCVYT
jgi:hypothetical protein